MIKYKPIINDLINCYYEIDGNSAGGNLHIVLDDGNKDHDSIIFCKERCKSDNDQLGLLICNTLLEFTENELEKINVYD